nr:F-box associated domain, type 1 [Tanacetum cinerariifolium]
QKPTQTEPCTPLLGACQWRSLGHVPYWLSGFDGPFVNGYVHWKVIDQDYPEKIYAFDLDNQTFKLSPSPLIEVIVDSYNRFQSLGVPNDNLYLAHDTFDPQFTIWVLKEYGIKKSWHKEVVIKESISPDLYWLNLKPVSLTLGLKDGTILIVFCDVELLAYCPTRKTVEDT